MAVLCHGAQPKRSSTARSRARAGGEGGPVAQAGQSTLAAHESADIVFTTVMLHCFCVVALRSLSLDQVAHLGSLA